MENSMLFKLKPVNLRDHTWNMTHITEFVIRADSEYEARMCARNYAKSSRAYSYDNTDNLWLNTNYVSCDPISVDGPIAVILGNYSNP